MDHSALLPSDVGQNLRLLFAGQITNMAKILAVPGESKALSTCLSRTKSNRIRCH